LGFRGQEGEEREKIWKTSKPSPFTLSLEKTPEKGTFYIAHQYLILYTFSFFFELYIGRRKGDKYISNINKG
jgi:hypothetical protein